MSKKTKAILGVLAALVVITVTGVYISGVNVAVLEPAGPIGGKEKRLMMEALLLSTVVVIPVYAMLFGFALRYRESNKKAKYSPNMDGSRLLETIWWGVPIILIAILAVITWRSSHELDPFKSLSSNQKPLNIQVVALPWRWLFIYPGQNVATMNYVKIPVGRPVDFSITSDAPMNSFWIPQLGGQIYAMSGMATHLNLQADKPGEYRGVSANISGQGFADMHFTASAVAAGDFNSWVARAQKSSDKLSLAAYQQLSKPADDPSAKTYSLTSSGIFDQVVAKYEAPVFVSPAEVAK